MEPQYLAFSTQSQPQTLLVVQPQLVTSEQHRENVDELIFNQREREIWRNIALEALKRW